MNDEHLTPEMRGKIEKAVAKGRNRAQIEKKRGRKKGKIPRPAGAPYWLPAGTFWERLPEGIRRAAAEILEPAYRRLGCAMG
jgi:hypothetical protein